MKSLRLLCLLLLSGCTPLLAANVVVKKASELDRDTVAASGDLVVLSDPDGLTAPTAITVGNLSLSVTPAWSQITSKPTTLTGYGITDATSDAELAAWAGSSNITTIGTLAAAGGMSNANPVFSLFPTSDTGGWFNAAPNGSLAGAQLGWTLADGLFLGNGTTKFLKWPSGANPALTFATTGRTTFAGAVSFTPTATTPGLRVGSYAGDPSTPSDGDLWYDSTANELTARINGADVALGAGGGSTLTDPGVIYIRSDGADAPVGDGTLANPLLTGADITPTATMNLDLGPGVTLGDLDFTALESGVTLYVRGRAASSTIGTITNPGYSTTIITSGSVTIGDIIGTPIEDANTSGGTVSIYAQHGTVTAGNITTNADGFSAGVGNNGGAVVLSNVTVGNITANGAAAEAASNQNGGNGGQVYFLGSVTHGTLTTAGGAGDGAGSAGTSPAPIRQAGNGVSSVGSGVTTFAAATNTSLTVPGSGTLALRSDKLSAFAATTSAELAGVLSDETGSGGGFVRATSSTLTTPVLAGFSTTSTATISPSNANVAISPTGTGTVTIAPATAGSISNMAYSGSTLALSGAITSSAAAGTSLWLAEGFRIRTNGAFDILNAGATEWGLLRSGITTVAQGSGGTFTSVGAATLQSTLAVTGAVTLSAGLITTPQALSGAGAVNVTSAVTKLTTTGAAQALTLADGTNGQWKTIIHAVDGGSAVLTPTTKTGFSTVTFTNLGEAVTLYFFTTQGWMIGSTYNATVAP